MAIFYTAIFDTAVFDHSYFDTLLDNYFMDVVLTNQVIRASIIDTILGTYTAPAVELFLDYGKNRLTNVMTGMFSTKAAR